MPGPPGSRGDKPRPQEPHPLRVQVCLENTSLEARMHLRALSTVRRITAARVFSPNPANRERFTKELADIGVPIAAVEQTRTVK